jgi:hypothetical protein
MSHPNGDYVLNEDFVPLQQLTVLFSAVLGERLGMFTDEVTGEREATELDDMLLDWCIGAIECIGTCDLLGMLRVLRTTYSYLYRKAQARELLPEHPLPQLESLAADTITGPLPELADAPAQQGAL